MVTIHRYSEHDDLDIDSAFQFQPRKIFFKNRRGEEETCLEIYNEIGGTKLRLSYYIGLDWIDDSNAIYVQPKLDNERNQTDYLTMLGSCLAHPDVLSETENLYQINFKQPHIDIDQREDLLTPLLLVHFLQITRIIVKKGLKRGYYSVEKNLKSRLKGKILTSKNLRTNIFKNQSLKTWCCYDEFGFNTVENRLIKRTLRFIQRYSAHQVSLQKNIADLLKYCLPAFDLVDDSIDLNAIKAPRGNPLFKEYSLAVKLAKLILEHFGHNIDAESSNKIRVPPFWIDMSRLFELYALGKLKDRFRDGVKYQFTRRWNELDYLVNTEHYKLIVDAKYKLKYGNTYLIEDIRQVSGYARLSAVYEELGIPENEVIDCLILYPDQCGTIELPEQILSIPINGFNKFFKIPMRLPSVNKNAMPL